MVSSPYLLQPTWNQFPSAPEGLKQDMCRFSVIQAHTARPFQVQYDCGTLCQSTFASYLLTVLRPNSTASVSSEHRTTSCFYHLHCIVFIGSYCSSFAARLSRYSPAYSLVVRYCSELSQHRYRKMKMTMSCHQQWGLCITRGGTAGLTFAVTPTLNR